MPNTGDEYNATPGNAIGATEYPSTKLAQADQLQAIQDKMLKGKKVVKKPGVVVAPSNTLGPYKFATESFTRHKLNTLKESKKSKYKTLRNRVKDVDSPGWDSKGFLPGGWRGDPTSAMLNQSYQ